MRRRVDLVLIATFVGATAGIGALSLLRPVDRESLARELRTPVPRPPIGGLNALKKYPGRFEDHFNDRLAFREPLLNLHAIVKVETLAVSSSDKVILGRDGWLFLDERSEGDRRIDMSTQAEKWKEAYDQRRAWLQGRGIDYLFVLTPEKHSVNLEALPGSLRPPQPVSAARILTAMNTNSGVLNLGDDLREARGPLYFRTDTHWNDLGAYVGYRALVKRLSKRNPEMMPIDRDRFDEVPVRDFVGDLARILHLPDPPREDSLTLKLRAPRARRRDLAVPLDPRLHAPQHLVPQAWGTGDKSLPRAIIFHDSFAERLWLPLLAEHFELLIYAPSPSLDPNLVEAFRPNVVIQQLVERTVNRHAPVILRDLE